MAKVVARPPTRTPPPPPSRPAARPQQAPPSRAQQAARHQGRAAAENDEQHASTSPRVPAQPRPTAPARPAPVSAPAAIGFGSDQMPDFMRGDANLGKENIDRDDLETPRLKLIQGLSPELQAYDDLRAGHFLHAANEFIFEEPFTAVPVWMDKRFILWRPRDNGGGILARADDGIHWSPAEGEFTVQLDRNQGGDTVTWKLAPTVSESGLANWGTMNPNDSQSPPAATRMYNFVLVFPDYPELMPAVLTFQRSGIKRARKFITMLKTTQTPLFGLRFKFSAFLDHNNSGQEFFNVGVVSDGLVTDTTLYKQYKGLYNQFADAGGVPIKDLESMQSEPGDEPQDVGDGNGGPRF